jgi:hypothetical protein
MSQINMDESEFDKRVIAAKMSREVKQQHAQGADEPQAQTEMLYNPVIDRSPDAPAHVVRAAAMQPRPMMGRPVKDDSKMQPQNIVMPETSTKPEAFNSVKVGTLTVFHSDDGGPFSTSREKVSVITSEGKRLDLAQQALWAVYQELKRLADAKKKS